MNLTTLVSQFNQLITTGQTLLAITQFYDYNVSVQENENSPHTGKERAYKTEQRNLDRVTNMSIQILNQSINEASGIVFSEYLIVFEDRQGKKSQLPEVSVQTWRNGLIVSEKFYYEKIIPLTT